MLRIEYIELSKLTPYKNNTRKHEERDINIIAESIKTYGFNDALGIWGERNIIVEGHGRYYAAKKLGMQSVPCVRLDHLTDQERKEYAIAHNRTAEMSAWDFELLQNEYADIDTDRLNLGDGFLFEFESTEDKDTDIIEDEPPEVNEDVPPICSRGDIWRLGEHRLMCGDSTSAADVGRLLDGATANMLFTDPPYGIEYQSNMRTQSAKFQVLQNDNRILDFFPVVKKYVDGFIYVCTTWKVIQPWQELFTRYYDLTNLIVWDKGGGGIGDLYHTFLTDYELIMCSNNGGHELHGRRYGSVWNFDEKDFEKMKKEDLINILIEQKEYASVWDIAKDSPNDYLHPTQKPVALSARAIKSSTERGESVLDLFGGSGSTLIAAEQLRRKAYIMELDPKYCDVIIRRYQNFTGKIAEKI